MFLARPERVGDGIRLAVKDLFDTAGVRTTYGSILFADHVPERTAEAVARLEAAGYVNVGKTNLHEFAYGVTSYNPHFGAIPNPIAPGRTAGGSSAGSAAALAAGVADAALGTDSGGSIRIPAACCGVVGFKPRLVGRRGRRCDAKLTAATMRRRHAPYGLVHDYDCIDGAPHALRGGAARRRSSSPTNTERRSRR